MTYTQLAYFIAAAEELNLTRVAEKTHVSQPAVSSAIRELEKEFGIMLFERRRGVLSLTPRGEYIYRRAKTLLAHYDEFYRSISLNSASGNTCTISFAPNVASLHLAGLYRYVKEKLPAFTLVLQEESIVNMTHMLKNNFLDAAIFSCSSESCDPSLTYIPVGKMELSVCAHPDLFWSEKPVISLSTLRDVPIVLQQRSSLQNEMVRQMFQRNGIVPNIVYESRQNTTMCIMVREAIAVGCLMPAELFRNDRKIRTYQLENVSPIDIYYVYKDKTPDVDTLLRLVKKYFRQAGR